jgi:hypothetical protein
VPAVLPDALRDLARRGEIARFFDALQHRGRPTRLFPPNKIARATASTIRRRPGRAGAVLREVGSVGSEQVRRLWRERRPVYADA